MDNYVLVIDDDDNMHALISDVLDRFGMDICCARSGHDGWFYLRQSVPELIILDLCMPRLTGWELVRQIRNEPTIADVPIVVLTSFPVDLRLAASLRLPPESIVRKSHLLTELPEVVGKIVA
jgi:CheY-like chemotaxis protein